ncbi:hypothetical protein SAMN05421788_10321 [Filimonas lacunae]|uniref:Uncharacterized protein n=1 Tax=Filimonas lacunae TaxID=477680 RepID=A0A173MJT2_9BACT|nr:hypothetical protein FLA_3702 [Filimonas lacunae]SIT03316.1 hypothetical protein SAMN05421788_10321 [Filimonas lacunae]
MQWEKREQTIYNTGATIQKKIPKNRDLQNHTLTGKNG